MAWEGWTNAQWDAWGSNWDAHGDGQAWWDGNRNRGGKGKPAEAEMEDDRWANRAWEWHGGWDTRNLEDHAENVGGARDAVVVGAAVAGSAWGGPRGTWKDPRLDTFQLPKAKKKTVLGSHLINALSLEGADRAANRPDLKLFNALTLDVAMPRSQGSAGEEPNTAIAERTPQSQGSAGEGTSSRGATTAVAGAAQATPETQTAADLGGSGSSSLSIEVSYGWDVVPPPTPPINQVLTFDYFRNFSNFTCVWKLHSAALKWFREIGEAQFRNNFDLAVDELIAEIVHPPGENFGFNRQVMHPYHWHELVAHLSNDSLITIFDRGGDRSRGIICLLYTSPSPRD